MIKSCIHVQYVVYSILYTVYTPHSRLDYYQVQVRLLAFPLTLWRLFSLLVFSVDPKKRREETHAVKKVKKQTAQHTQTVIMIMIMIIREEPAKVSLMNFVVIVISKAIYSKWSSLAAANPADAKRSLVCLFLCAFPFLSFSFPSLPFFSFPCDPFPNWIGRQIGAE